MFLIEFILSLLLNTVFLFIFLIIKKYNRFLKIIIHIFILYFYYIFNFENFILIFNIIFYLFINFQNYSKKLIGLTGTIGSGKSTIIEEFYINNKFKIIDCDKLVIDLYKANTNCNKEIINIVGNEYKDKDGNIDKIKLGKLFFDDKIIKIKVEKIAHKYIFRELIKNIIFYYYFNINNKFIIIDAPLLFETKILYYLCFPIILIFVENEENWIKRIIKRNKELNEKDIKKRINYQYPVNIKKNYSNILINNDIEYNDLEDWKRNTFDKINSLLIKY